MDDNLHKVPFGFELATVVMNNGVTREMITKKQMWKFLKWTASIKLMVEFTKTNAGIRKLLMTKDVAKCFRASLRTRSRQGLKR